MMKRIFQIAAGNALLLGCASPSGITVSEPVRPAPTAPGQPALQSSLQVYSARGRRPYNPNQNEFRMNNDFGTNDFLYRPAHSDYGIYSEDGKLLQDPTIRSRPSYRSRPAPIKSRRRPGATARSPSPS